MYRLEIQKTGHSYLALVYGSKNFVYLLTSKRVRDGKRDMRTWSVSAIDDSPRHFGSAVDPK